MKLLDQRLVAPALLDGVEVGTLNILDQGGLEHLAIGEIAHDHRHIVQARALSCTPAPLACNNLKGAVTLGAWANKNGLENAFFADRVGELRQRLLVKMPARLQRTGSEKADRQCAG